MEERDLARPVIEVRDFETGTLVNEIYTYGEQTIVMDIGMVEQSKKAKMKQDKTPVQLIAEREILRTMKRIVPKAAIEVSMESDRRVNIYITEKYIPKIIGKGGKRITELENDIGISMNVEPLDKAPDSFSERLSKRSKKSKSKKEKHKKSKKSQLKEYNDNIKDYAIDEGKKDYSKDNYYDLSEDDIESYDDEDFEEGETSEFYYEVFELYPEIRKDHIVLPIGKKYVGCAFDILLEDKYLFTATVGKRGYVKLHKNLDLTDEIIDGLDKGLRVVARVRD
jgi:ATPase